MEDASAVQLRLIHEVDRLLSQAKIPHWLFGGWSVDFHAGSITRPHGDVEFFIWERDGPRAGDILHTAGYQLVDHPHPDEASIWRKQGQVVEFYFHTVNEDGDVVGRGRWDNWPLPQNALGGEVRVVQGVPCPVVSVECILNTKLEYAEHTGVSPRDRDLADVTILRRALDTR